MSLECFCRLRLIIPNTPEKKRYDGDELLLSNQGQLAASGGFDHIQADTELVMIYKDYRTETTRLEDIAAVLYAVLMCQGNL
jgi:hypothetical protein